VLANGKLDCALMFFYVFPLNSYYTIPESKLDMQNLGCGALNLRGKISILPYPYQPHPPYGHTVRENNLFSAESAGNRFN